MGAGRLEIPEALSVIPMPSEEEHIATLVPPDEYVRNANQMASVSTRKLLFVKRKELALKPFELLQFPISALVR